MYTDYAHDANDRRSASSGVTMFARACVAFYSRTQKSNPLSSTEAEYVVMASCFRDPISMRYFWVLCFPDYDVGCTTVKGHNRGTINFARNL